MKGVLFNVVMASTNCHGAAKLIRSCAFIESLVGYCTVGIYITMENSVHCQCDFSYSNKQLWMISYHPRA